MVDYSHQGSVSTGIYTGLWEDERPKHYRQGIAKIFPNGMMPLTALTSFGRTEKVNDPEFSFWEEDLAQSDVAIGGIFTNAILDAAYASGAVAGTTLYIQFTDNANGSYSKQFRAGHTVLIVNDADYNVQKRAQILSVVSINSTSAYIAVKMLQDDNSSGNKLDTANYCMIIGNANPELGVRPDAIVNRPRKLFNYTQIFRDSLSLSRTVMSTHLRTEDAYKKSKKDALEQHGLAMEKSLIWGYPYETTGTNGQPMRFSAGLFYWTETNAPSDNIDDYRLNSSYAGKTWIDKEGGMKWLNDRLEKIFRYGRPEKLAVCGSGALLGINEIVQNNGQFNFTTKTIGYGTQIIQWTTPFGVIYLKTHPLFSYISAFRNTMLLLEPENIKTRVITESHFKPDGSMDKSDTDGKDGKEEEFLGELGWEFVNSKSNGILYGVGLNNVLAQ